MKNNAIANDSPRLYLGVDVGGTKVQSSLVRESGEIIGREKCPTPRKGGPERVVAAIEKSMDDMIRKGGIAAGDLSAVGIAVPGVVDPDRGLVVVAPNMALTGVDLGSLLTARFRTPIVIGNDGNFGAGRNLARFGPQRQERDVHLRRHGHRRRAGAARQALARRPGIGRRDRPHDHATRRPEMRLRRPRLF